MLLLLAYPGSFCCSLAQGAIAPCHCCPLARREKLLPASPGSHSWSLTQGYIVARQERHSLLPASHWRHCCSLAKIVIAAPWPRKLTNPGSQCFLPENGVTTVALHGCHCCSLPQGSFAAGRYPGKSLLVASPWSHFLLLLAYCFFLLAGSQRCFPTQGITATRYLKEPLLHATSGSHCSQVQGIIAAHKPSKSVLSAIHPDESLLVASSGSYCCELANGVIAACQNRKCLLPSLAQ